MQEYTPKYNVHRDQGTKTGVPAHKGPKPKPKTWQTDRYYALMKHRAQARFRGELHTLTEQEWNAIWTETHWSQRGRKPHNLALWRLDPAQAWSKHNVCLDLVCNKGFYQWHRHRQNKSRINQICRFPQT